MKRSIPFQSCFFFDDEEETFVFGETPRSRVRTHRNRRIGDMPVTDARQTNEV